MKKIYNQMSVATLIAIVTCANYACSYDEVGDVALPASIVYIPSAGERFELSKFDTTQVALYRFNADRSKLTFPLSIYRSGISASGDVMVDLGKNSVVITTDPGLTELPHDKLQFPSSVKIESGSHFQVFEVDVDLSYWLANPGNRYGFAIEILNATTGINAVMDTKVIVLDPAFLTATADFTFTVDVDNPNSFRFVNSSENALTYLWDFGDDTSSAEKSPVHTFAGPGSYTVKLTAVGLLGDAAASIKEMNVTIN